MCEIAQGAISSSTEKDKKQDKSEFPILRNYRSVMLNFYKYRVEVYGNDKCIGTFQYVANVWFISFWLRINPIYKKWTGIKVYDRLTDTFIAQYSRDEDIPAKP